MAFFFFFLERELRHFWIIPNNHLCLYFYYSYQMPGAETVLNLINAIQLFAEIREDT